MEPFDVPYGMDVAQANAIASFAPDANKIIAENQSPGEPWYETAQKLMTALVMNDQQRQLMKLNIERAKRGERPIDINAYSGYGVNVGLSQGTERLVTYALLGVGAFLLLNMYRR